MRMCCPHLVSPDDDASFGGLGPARLILEGPGQHPDAARAEAKAEAKAAEAAEEAAARVGASRSAAAGRHSQVLCYVCNR
jgi:hypothetical protein